MHKNYLWAVPNRLLQVDSEFLQKPVVLGKQTIVNVLDMPLKLPKLLLGILQLFLQPLDLHCRLLLLQHGIGFVHQDLKLDVDGVQGRLLIERKMSICRNFNSI